MKLKLVHVAEINSVRMSFPRNAIFLLPLVIILIL